MQSDASATSIVTPPSPTSPGYLLARLERHELMELLMYVGMLADLYDGVQETMIGRPYNSPISARVRELIALAAAKGAEEDAYWSAQAPVEVTAA